jgi:hypothetical protein
MRYWLRLLIIWTVSCRAVYAADITTDDVYFQILKLNEEIKLLKQHFNITENVNTPQLTIRLSPRHTWQKAYEVLFKLNVLREKIGMATLSIPSRQPMLHVSPTYSYEQVLRVLTEVNIIKRHLGITEEAKLQQSSNSIIGKTSTDNFNFLNHISEQLDLLNGLTFTPSHAFSQAIRVLDDINILLEHLNILDESIAPVRQPAMPPDVFNLSITLLDEVRRLQRLANIESIDSAMFKILYKSPTPSEVFSMLGIVLAELQTLKGYLGLRYALTPSARHYENMSPENVFQAVGWGIRKLKLIKNLSRAG